VSPQRGKRGWHSSLSLPPTPSNIFKKNKKRWKKEEVKENERK
jgi:hypothetical protein